MEVQYDMIQDITNTKIVTFLYSKYKDIYRCSKRGIFWKFDNNKWQRLCPNNKSRSTNTIPRSGSLKKLHSQIAELSKIITSDITKYYDELIEYYKNIPLIISGKEINLRLIARDMISKLHSSAFKKEIIDDLRTRIYETDLDFKNKLDSKPNLIGFNNGIYDLEKHEFRVGQFDDYVSLSTGYDYVDKTSKYNDDLLQFLADIQPVAENKQVLLKYISSCLKNIDAEHICMYGSNDKFQFIDLIKATFGQYFTMFLDKADDVILLKKKRFACCVTNKASSFLECLIMDKEIEYKKTKFLKVSIKIGLMCVDKLTIFDYDKMICIEFIADTSININEIHYLKQDFMLLLMKYI